jgi:hypothetical protein
VASSADFAGPHPVITTTFHHKPPNLELLQGSAFGPECVRTRAEYKKFVERLASGKGPLADELNQSFAKKVSDEDQRKD